MTDVRYFPAANLRCGNNDLELHFPPLLELNRVILHVSLANEGYLTLFSLVKRYHRGWIYTSCHADEKLACLCSPRPPAEGEIVQKALEPTGWSS